MGQSKDSKKPGRAEAAKAVETLIRWAGDDPLRPGMKETPDRVLDFYSSFFTGYGFDAAMFQNSQADDVTFDDFIVIQNIPIESFCEHHMLPAQGYVDIAYIPGDDVPGLGAVTRLVSEAARRLTTQEDITKTVVSRLEDALGIGDVAVKLNLSHGCMQLRGKENKDARVVTTAFAGYFSQHTEAQNKFLILTQTQEGDRDVNDKR